MKIRFICTLLMVVSLEVGAVALDAESRKPCFGPDFSGQDLSDVDFRAEDLRCANFSRSNLTRTNFDGSNLRGSKFIGAIGTDTSFRNATISNADLSKASLRRADFSMALMQDVIFDGSVISWSSYRETRLERASFHESIIQRADFSGATMTKANLFSADARFALFDNARMDCAELSRADLTGASFVDTNLSGAKFEGSHLKSTTWKDGKSIKGVPSRLSLEIINKFVSNPEGWSSYDYKIVDGVESQGFYPILWKATGGPGGKSFVWTNDQRWGIDFPDSKSVLALVYYPAATLDLAGATINVSLRARGIMSSGATVQFFMRSTQGNRFHLVGAPLKLSETWHDFALTLPDAQQFWRHTYNRNSGSVETLSEAMKNIEEIGFSFLDFKDKPAGQIDMSNFVISGFKESYPANECRPVQAGTTITLKKAQQIR